MCVLLVCIGFSSVRDFSIALGSIPVVVVVVAAKFY